MSRTALPTSNPTILASGRTLDTDTWTTRINNNMLVIGPSGAGKTRHVLKPNLMQMNASFIVLDTKGQLCREMGPLLRSHGYVVQNINFSNMDAACPRCASPVGYDPLAFIRRDPANGRPSQQDILSVATAICPAEDLTSPSGTERRPTCCLALSPTPSNSCPPPSRPSNRLFGWWIPWETAAPSPCSTR